jgi:primosomal protein N' (replication factor Y)
VALAHQKRLTTLRLLERAKKQPLPAVRVIDLRHVGAGPSGHPKLSLPLHRALEHVLAQKEQAILFLNRRGFAPTILCEACGEILRCPRCDVSLTLHSRRGTRARRDGTLEEVPPGVRCHYCDHLEPTPRACKKCKSEKLSLEGTGTEKLEEVLSAAFPSARVARLDRDVGGGKQVEQVLRRMRAREVDILVGTQMVTKGHDLPFVTLVGVIDADGALSLPDFRAAERTFQLLVQVAGRAGRADLPGTVIVQTRSPDQPAIACAARHDVTSFLAEELQNRQELGYPPYSRLVLVRLEGPDEPRTAAVAARLAAAARRTREVEEGHVEVGGPMPAPMPRVRDRFRYRVLLRGQRPLVRNVALAVRGALAEESLGNVRVVLDVDPLSMM